MITTAELTAMQTTQNTALPGSVVIQRYAFTTDGQGGYTEVWSNVGTVSGRIYPRSIIGLEMEAGSQPTSVTRWWATLPVGTTITATDRLSYQSRTWEVVRVNNDEMYQTAVRCECVAYNEENRS
jgi:head-tail adaptor